MDKLKNEPVAGLAVLLPIITYLAAHFGFDVDEDTAATIAGVVLAAGGVVARGLVRTKRTLPDPTAVKAAPTTLPPDLPPPTTGRAV